MKAPVCICILLFPAAAFLTVFICGCPDPAAIVEAKDKAETSKCINNLRQIDAAKEMYAMEYMMPTGSVLTVENIKPYIQKFDEIYCPSAKGSGRTFDGSYEINPLDVDPVCKIEPTDKEGEPCHVLDF